MASRLELHELLCEILGTRNAYFQPPASVRMKYPAIVYSLDDVSINRADDGAYTSKNRYLVTAITDDPDSELISKLALLPLCRFNRYYVSDNLNHYVFVFYY